MKQTKISFSYVGQTYKQGSSDLELVTFCAKANDIKKWGGVPTKAAIFHGGFQRALSDRYKDIVTYFNDGQASPTGIVVAFRPGQLSIEPLPYPSQSWPDQGKLSDDPQFARLAFDIDAEWDTAPTKSLCDAVAGLLKPRLEASGNAAADTEAELEEEQSTEGEEGETVVDDSETTELQDSESTTEQQEASTSQDDLNIGHSKLKEFYIFITDIAKVEDWIARGDAAIGKSASHGDNDSSAKACKRREDDLRAVLRSLLCPALIVDGQHRIWGAYNSDSASDITFTVNAIKDADWIQQVFQFVILNKLAKPISPGFLTSILNTSLTNLEVNSIEGVLERAGIKNRDRVLMKYLNHDTRSPFRGMICEPGEMVGTNNTGKLSDKGMISLMRKWFSINRDSPCMQMFQPALKARNISQAREMWKKNYDTWVPFFYAFWDTIRSQYQPHGIWEKADQYYLLYIVTMHSMQDMFLEAKSGGDARFKDVNDFKTQVAEYFAKVPPTFFQGWPRTGLQSGDGPDMIKDAIKALRNGKQLVTVQEEEDLFKPVGRQARRG
jgi:hypothetical protein